jgi:hypothetical protein
MEKVYNSSSLSGKANFGWLNANYSFSFTNCTNHIQLRLTRDLKEDVIAPGRGFGTHPQGNMKNITLPLPEALKYPDSKCQDTTVRSAGSGSIYRFICILEIFMLNYQLHIFKSKNPGGFMFF